MIVQEIYLGRYDWRVRIYYAVTTYWSGKILDDLAEIGCSGSDFERVRCSLLSGDMNTGITYSNCKWHESVMVISLTSTPEEFQNSWDHEKGHLCRHISKTCGIDPYGEEAQYLAGDIGQKMFPVAKMFLCEHCRKMLLKDRRQPVCQ